MAGYPQEKESKNHVAQQQNYRLFLPKLWCSFHDQKMRNIKRPPPTDDQNITSQKGIGLGYNPGGCQEQGHYNQERERDLVGERHTK